MSDISVTVDTYLAAYSEADAPTRLGLLERSFDPAGRLIDPPLDAASRRGISAMMAAVQDQFPPTSSVAPPAWTPTMGTCATAGSC